MASNPIAKSGKAEAIFLILLLLSSGVSAPAAFGLQRYQLGYNFSQLNLSVTQPSNPNGGGFFFSNVETSGSAGGSYFHTSAGEETPNLLLPQIPVTGGGADYIYVKQGNAYSVFPENILESGGNHPALIVFGPLLAIWIDSERRRSRFRIYVEILDLLRKGPMTPYEVSFHLRLNSKRTKEYIEFLCERKFLECSYQEDKHVCTITPPGATFVQNMRMILDDVFE